MFKNIGKKLKTFARVVYVLVMIVFLLTALVNLIGFIQEQNSANLIACLLYLMLSPLAAWGSSCMLYAAGDVVSNIAAIKRQLCDPPLPPQVTETPAPLPITESAPIPSVEEKPVAPPAQPDSRYACFSIICDDEASIGRCEQCFCNNTTVVRCGIKNEVGTKYRALCGDCIAKFKQNARKP